MEEQFDPASSRHLVAPELAPGLELIPAVDFARGLELWRGPIPIGRMAPLPEALAAVSCSEQRIPGPKGAPDVRVLIYTPPQMTGAPRPALLNIHGGGYVIGQPEQNDLANRASAAALGCPVVAPAYRLAPETPFPGAVEDCYAVLCWMADHAAELGIDRDRIAVSGESAGGGHAAALAIHARNRKRIRHEGPTPCFQLLDSPMLDDRTGTLADPHPYTGEFVWTPAHNRFGWGALLGCEPGGDDVPVEAVPARIDDLHDLPPACIIVGALDLFLEEDLEYARRLTRAGVPVEVHVIPGAYHGFGVAGRGPLIEQKKGLELAALRRGLGLA
jgi:triacylglycerol lipase